MEHFCSEVHHLRWLEDHPEEKGFVINFEQSARICKTFYGSLISDCGGDPKDFKP